MTRILLAIAAAVPAAMALLTSTAEACISCEYVPSVAHSPAPSYGSSHYKMRRIYTATKERRAHRAKKHVAKSEPVVKKAKTVKAAKAAPVKAAVKATPVKATPASTEAETENSSISTAASETREPVEETAKASKTETENSTISTATLDTSAASDAKDDAAAEPEVGNVGCKKFFPTVGMTLSVPCQ